MKKLSTVTHLPRFLIILFTGITFSLWLLCQNADADPQSTLLERSQGTDVANIIKPNPPPEAIHDPSLSYLTSREFILSVLVIIFGTIALISEYLLLRKMEMDADAILKVFSVTFILVGTLFLIAAGFGSKQIAPAMGLFGTLAGYLLGRQSERKGDAKS